MALSKKSRAATADQKEDRMTNLPDGVLNHILSFLPTKTTVSTARLSSRWRHLWKDISVLNFSDDSHEYNHQQSERFKSFAVMVNSVIALLHKPREVRKMTLECAHSLSDDKFREYSVDTWVRAVIGPHLEKLNLIFSFSGEASDFKLPQTLFTSTNLVSLRLSGGITLQMQSATTVSFPSLKEMLINIGYVEVPSLNALLGGCPIVEILDLCFSMPSLDKVCVPPSLKRLKIVIDNDLGASLEINAPVIEYLNITNITFGEVFSMNNLPNIVEAYLDVFPQLSGSVISLHILLGALSGTRHLLLSRSTTKWLLREPHDLLFQEFHHLLRLELILPWFNCNSLLTLLQKCPMLRDLVIQHDKERSPILGWPPQPSVPNCLVSHLNCIQFKGFRGLQDELLFVEYILRHGLVLETMIVADISLDLKKKYFILKLLSDVPRASGKCKLKFD
ncbi:F-box/FBD/LRR-repeat protein [Trifolium pratense]|uniref:F-box/FBD/LRR-repeat protein n=1 Tax=Trifolium pratense TaxID=57577 RepID=A0A2K3PAF9_TRIPR|nr:F-box/FBD/LRR-repeat protein [Trifolium pratense]